MANGVEPLLGGAPASPWSPSTPSTPKRRDSWQERTLSPMEQGSLRGSVLALASTAFGSGVLALPWVFASMGLLLGTLLMAIGALAAFTSLRLLANAAFSSGVTDYAKMVHKVLGSRSVAFLDAVVLLYCAGCICGYFVFLEQFGPLLMVSLHAPSWLQRPSHLVFVLAVFPVLPLSLLRRLSSMRYASLGSTAALIVVAALIVIEMPGKYSEMEASDVVLQLWMPPSNAWALLPRAASIFFFAFCCHVNAFAAYSGMENPVPARVDKVIARSMLLMIFVYGAVGVCGFISYGPACLAEIPASAWPPCTPTNILASPRFHGPVSIVSRACMGGALLVSIPLNLYGARTILERRLLGGHDARAGKQEPSTLMHVSLTFGILFSMLLLAVAYRNVNNILGVLGGFGAVSFMFTVPVAAMLVMYFGQCSDGFGDRARMPQIGSWLGVTRSGVIVLAVFMTFCVFTGYFSAGMAIRAMLAAA